MNMIKQFMDMKSEVVRCPNLYIYILGLFQQTSIDVNERVQVFHQFLWQQQSVYIK